MPGNPNPVEQITGLTTGENVSKPDFVLWAKDRVAQIIDDAAEIRTLDLSAQSMLVLASNARTYKKDAADTTTSDDGSTCIRDANGIAFKLVAIDGLDGHDGADAFYVYTFAVATMSPPAAGTIRANNADLSVATELYVSKTTRAGSVVGTRLLEIGAVAKTTKDKIILMSAADDKQASFNVNSVTDNGAFVTYVLSNHNGETAFDDVAALSLQPIITGTDGVDGLGVAGAFVVEKFSGDGVTTAFNLSGDAGSIDNVEVFISGVRQRPTTDYTWVHPTVTFLSAPPLGTNNILIRRAETFSVGTIADESIGAPQIVSLIRSAIAIPSGRLTLTSGEAMMKSDVTSAATLRYTPDVSDVIWLPTSTGWHPQAFTELALPLDSNSGHSGYHQSGKLFDVYIVDVGGVAFLATVQNWTSNNARTSGTTPVRMNGRWTNPVAMTMRYGTGAVDTIDVDAYRAAFVGTIYCHTNGLVSAVFKPAHVTGGANNIIGVCNAYNRRQAVAINADLTFSWTNTEGEQWLPLNYKHGGGEILTPNVNNRITFVDCFGDVTSQGSLRCVFGGTGHVGVAFNNTASVLPGTFLNGNIAYVSNATQFPRLIGNYSGVGPFVDGQQEGSPFASMNFGQAAGLCYYQAMEFNDTSGGTFPSHTMTMNGAGSELLKLDFEY